MNQSLPTSPNERITESLLAFGRCSKQHRIIVAGSKSIELMFDLRRRGYDRAASTANCGLPAGQYDVALVDWRRRTFRVLETTLDWLVDFLGPTALLVVWVDPQKPAANEELRSSVKKRGFVIEDGTVHEYGYVVSARRLDVNLMRKAA
jgi:hypothetical protein